MSVDNSFFQMITALMETVVKNYNTAAACDDRLEVVHLPSDSPSTILRSQYGNFAPGANGSPKLSNANSLILNVEPSGDNNDSVVFESRLERRREKLLVTTEPRIVTASDPSLDVAIQKIVHDFLLLREQLKISA